MSDIGTVHTLFFLLHEDEAQIKALSFKVVGKDAIEISEVYNCPEYVQNPPKTVSRHEARDIWKKRREEFYWSAGHSWMDKTGPRENWKPKFTPAPNAKKLPVWGLTWDPR